MVGMVEPRSYQHLASLMPDGDEDEVQGTNEVEMVLDINDPVLYLYHVRATLEEYGDDVFVVRDFQLLGVMTHKERVFTNQETLKRLAPRIKADLDGFFDGERQVQYLTYGRLGSGERRFDSNKRLYMECKAVQDEERLLSIVENLPTANDNMTLFEKEAFHDRAQA
mgnify:CR=1 FL=1